MIKIMVLICLTSFIASDGSGDAKKDDKKAEKK